MSPRQENPQGIPSIEDTVISFDNLVGSDTTEISKAHPLGEDFTVCQKAARILGLTGGFVRGSPPADASLEDCADSLGLCARPIDLAPKWWLADHGVLIVRDRQSNRPVLLNSSSSGTAMVCTALGGQGSFRVLTAEIASTLHTQALALHPSLPQGPLKFTDVFVAGLKLYPHDFRNYLLIALLTAVISYSIPTASGLIVDQVLPHRSADLLGAVVLAVVATNIFGIILRRTLEMVAQRLEGGAGTHIQSGLLDRIFRQPLGFFSAFTHAELLRRISAVEGARRTVMRILLSSTLDILTLLVGWVVLAIYFPKGALLVLGFSIFMLGLSVYLASRSYRAFFEGETMSTNVMTIVYELVAYMTPIRTYGVQRRAFLRWRDNFIEMRRRIVRSTRYGIVEMAAQQAGHVVLLGCIFAVVAYSNRASDNASLGFYIAFISALSLVTGALNNLSNSILTASSIVPSIQMAKPVLAASPETSGNLKNIHAWDGSIELSHLSFRYGEQGPRVLSDISLRIEPGEYLGVVGPSGAGKSTLVRVLLGLTPPSQGSISFGSVDARSIHMERLRERCGVLLQESRLVPGTIFENVSSGRPVDLEQVLNALNIVGLGEFVESLPMGVHTMISEGLPGFSGGQMQLLSLARALVGTPKLLVFDEPTSALDNLSVTRVSQLLSHLSMTRIVITHRLGTLQACDRVVVLDQGSLVQQGKFDDLVRQPGIFQQMLNKTIG